MHCEMTIPQITGTSGAWTDVTPAAIDLTADFGPGTNDNYGIQDIWADPVRPGVAYAFTCFDGCYVTSDYGLTWKKRSKGGGPLDYGKNWGEAITPDGRILYATSGNNFDTQLGGEGRRRVMRSYDWGETWEGPSALAVDGYCLSLNPSNDGHLIALSHDDNHLYESTNRGTSWTDKGEVIDGAAALSISGYVHWVTSTVALAISQTGGSTGLFKCVRAAAGTWTFTQVGSSIRHDHGAHQLCIDAENDWVYVPGEGGIYRSAYSGALTSWTQVSTDICTSVAKTTTTLYGTRWFPDNTGASIDPKIQTASRTAGSTWTLQSTPAGMANGGKTLAALTDGRRWVLLAGAGNDGIWRYVE